jgi:hypothetical protein
LFSNISTSLQTTLADEAYLTEGKLLLEEQSLNLEHSLIYGGGTGRAVSEREGQNLEPS